MKDIFWASVLIMIVVVFAAAIFDQVLQRSSDVMLYNSPKANVHCYSNKEFGQHAMSCFYQEDVE